MRQTRWDSLLRPSQGVDGRWTVDAWAPLDGRVFNGGVRIELLNTESISASRSYGATQMANPWM